MSPSAQEQARDARWLYEKIKGLSDQLEPHLEYMLHARGVATASDIAGAERLSKAALCLRDCLENLGSAVNATREASR